VVHIQEDEQFVALVRGPGSGRSDGIIAQAGNGGVGAAPEPVLLQHAPAGVVGAVHHTRQLRRVPNLRRPSRHVDFGLSFFISIVPSILSEEPLMPIPRYIRISTSLFSPTSVIEIRFSPRILGGLDKVFRTRQQTGIRSLGEWWRSREEIPRLIPLGCLDTGLGIPRFPGRQIRL